MPDQEIQEATPKISELTGQILKLSDKLVEEKKLKVGQRKDPVLEVDRKSFAKMCKALSHGYTTYYTGTAGVRILAQMAGITSGNYDEEREFFSKMLEEADE